SYRDAMPRSFMVYNAAVRDDGLAVGLVTDGPNSLRDAAWIAPSATARSFFNYSSPAYDPGDARITSYAAEKISVRASAKDDGYLVLADSYFPGWAARVDGKESPIERVDFAFRGVFLPKGEHTVVFEYAPATFRTGAAITVLSLLMLCGALLAGTLRGRALGRML
ncbi:MAG TPA: YfhO family protein, partial [Chloroflexota bacterium]